MRLTRGPGAEPVVEGGAHGDAARDGLLQELERGGEGGGVINQLIMISAGTGRIPNYLFQIIIIIITIIIIVII